MQDNVNIWQNIPMTPLAFHSQPPRQGLAACLLSACCFLLPGRPAADAPFEWRRVENNAFRAGEKIEYELRYGVISAGKSSLEVPDMTHLNGRKVYHIVSHAKTNRTFDKVFKVRDTNESWMDAEALCSLRFTSNLREGGYRKQTQSDFNHAAATFSYVKAGKDRFDDRNGAIQPFVQDALSALYYIRAIDLQVGQEYVFSANSDGKNWPMKVIVKGVENVDLKMGTFTCFLLEPVLAGEGIFKSKGKLEVWVTTDKRRIPVRMRSEVAVGSFTVDMKDYSVHGKPLSELKD